MEPGTVNSSLSRLALCLVYVFCTASHLADIPVEVTGNLWDFILLHVLRFVSAFDDLEAPPHAVIRGICLFDFQRRKRSFSWVGKCRCWSLRLSFKACIGW